MSRLQARAGCVEAPGPGESSGAGAGYLGGISATPSMTDIETQSQEAAVFTHLDAQGRARMVDVSAKADTPRTAVAAGRVRLGRTAFDAVRDHQVGKGDVLTVAQVAGVLGAKQASRLIPLCHDVLLQNVEVEFELNEPEAAVDIRAIAKTTGPTGVEMEALTAVSVAALTVYDMCKSVSRELQIDGVRLLAKTGGRSGDYRRTN